MTAEPADGVTRFGLVGTGYWATEIHAAALAAHPQVELAGVWGRSTVKAEELAAQHGARAYAHAAEMFADVDAVAFAVPPDVQAELAVRAAGHGCHLLLDKPVAFTVAQADAVVDAVAAAGVRSIVFFTSRFVPNVAQWLAAAGSADVWVSARIRMQASIFEPGNPFGRSPWRRQKGALWDVGPHALSLVLPLLGPAVEVVALPGRGDAVEVVLRHLSGSVSTVAVSLTAPAGSQGNDAVFFGERTSTTVPSPDATQVEAMTACICALIAESQGDWHHPCDVRFGRDVVAVLSAAQTFLDRPVGNRGVVV